jgi:hypothetical protein
VSTGFLIGRARSDILVHVSTPADQPAQPSTPAEQADPAPR